MFSVCEKDNLHLVFTVYSVTKSVAGYPMFLIFDDRDFDWHWKYASLFVPEREARWYEKAQKEGLLDNGNQEV